MCAHGDLCTDEKSRKAWIKPGSMAHSMLAKIITEPQLLEDMEKMTEQVHTTYLEVFHSVKIRYLPKSVYFKMEKMIAGTQLAVLEHNHNVSREQVSICYLVKHTIQKYLASFRVRFLRSFCEKKSRCSNF